MKKLKTLFFTITTLLLFASSGFASTSSANTNVKNNNIHLLISGPKNLKFDERKYVQLQMITNNFYVTCTGGTTVLCGWVIMFVNPADHTIWYYEAFSACADPDICAGHGAVSYL